MKRAVQTLFLLLVLILSFSLVSCDEEETVTTTEPSERRTLATVPSFPSFTVEIPVNPIAFEKAYALQYDFLREKIAELEEIAFTDGDFVALEEKIEALTKNVTDSEQEIILLYGSKTLEALRETKNPTFYYNSLGLELCALASKAKSKSLPIVQAIIQDCMLQVQPGWWSDLPYFALSIRQTQETESQIQQKYEELSQEYTAAWNLLFEGKNPVDATGKMRTQQKNYGDFQTQYQDYLAYLTRKGRGVDDSVYQTKPHDAFMGELYRQFEEQTKTADFWKNLQQEDWVYFGAFEQDNNLENGKEPLLWRVEEGHNGTLYLDCYSILKYMQWTEGDYEKDPTLLYWENCPIRTWLNGEFYETAFTQEEKKWIATALLENDWQGGMGGADTLDRVFLLSECEGYSTRIHKATDYAKATGKASDYYGENYVWRRDTAYKTYQGFWNGYRGVAPCVQIQIPAA